MMRDLFQKLMLNQMIKINCKLLMPIHENSRFD